MSKKSKTPITQKRASDIQSAVDRKPNATQQQKAFKVRTTRAAARNNSK